MGTVDKVRTIKIAIGCSVSFLIAEGLGLRYTNSVVTITLLSVLGTRRDTFQTAGKRCLSFGIALTVGTAAFAVLPMAGVPYMVLNLGLYLAVFLMLCQKLRLMEGFSMSTVLMLHMWREPEITLGTVANEIALMAIGILMGVAASVYMPDRIKEIRRAQKQVEEYMRKLFLMLAREIEQGGAPAAPGEKRAEDILNELKGLLRQALLYVEYTEKNALIKTGNAAYLRKYMEMREEQRQLLKRIRMQVGQLGTPYFQSLLVAGLLRETAGSLDEHNNSGALLMRLEEVRRECRGQRLPLSREEFEERARLFGIVGLLQELLELKYDFSAGLKEEEIRRFWKILLPKGGN